MESSGNAVLQDPGPLYAEIDDLFGINLYISFGLFCVHTAGQSTRLCLFSLRPHDSRVLTVLCMVGQQNDDKMSGGL